MAQRIGEKIGSLTTIEAKFHLLQIGREMLRRNLMPGSDHATLEQRERGFNGVGMNVSIHIDVQLVPDRLVSSVLAENSGRTTVWEVVIGEQNVHILTDVLLDEFAECARLHVFRMEETQFATALPNADHDFFVL